jgi:hypothetical protein
MCKYIQDLVDPVADEQLAKFVVESHRRSHPNQPHFGEPNQVITTCDHYCYSYYYLLLLLLQQQLSVLVLISE